MADVVPPTHAAGATPAERAPYDMPEFTRSLRGFASVAGLQSRSHALVFGPLLAARRSAMRVQAAQSRASAFDAARLRKSLDDAIAAISAESAEGDGPTERALTARLEEAAAPVFEALDSLRARADDVKRAAPAVPAAQWDAWCRAVQHLFDAADAFWLRTSGIAPESRRGPLRLGIPLVLAMLLGWSPGAAGAQHATLRVTGAAPESLLRAGFDVVGAAGGGVLVVAGPQEQARLASLGFAATLMPAPAAIPPAGRGPGGAQAKSPVYRPFDDPIRGVAAWADSIARANPRVSLDTIGSSYEGRPILALKVGPRGDGPLRQNVAFLATYHAREWAATEMALRLVAYLAAPPGLDARRDSLVQARDIWVVPVANPDGYQYTFTSDRLWRKTRSPHGTAVGVDMNRNHTVNWGLDDIGSSPIPDSDIYRGPSAASEPETRAIETFLAAHPPVASISYHTYTGLIMYPPTAVYGQLPADLPVYRALAGTNVRSAAADNLPGSLSNYYSPGPAWLLYATNGDYTDFASARLGALAFTQELTTGYGQGGYYGFEFPDDETLLGQMFSDALPFALDLLDAAAAPRAFTSASTGRGVDALTIESASPAIRAIVPAPDAPRAAVIRDAPVPFRVDSAAGGRYMRRLVTADSGREGAFSVKWAGNNASFRLLAVSGAEPHDQPWIADQFVADTLLRRAGTRSWKGTNGTLTSPPVAVPAAIDTVSLAFWNVHFGSNFSPLLKATVEMTVDGGSTWTLIAMVRGFAPEWYPEEVVLGGMRGKTMQVRFRTDAMQWQLDEIAVVGHTANAVVPSGGDGAIVPSENPVRLGTVRLKWPWPDKSGDLIAYDFSGREVWRRRVADGSTTSWDLATQNVANGVYLVVARSGASVARLKLFVARRTP